LDIDNDADLDIYLANEGANKVFRNRGGGVFQDATVVPLGDTGSGKAVAVADCDGDGRTDIYLANSGGANRLFRNQYQPDNKWLKVRLVGVSSDAAGIGARVRVVAGGVSQVREVSGGSGYCSQNTLVAEFGLGAAAVVDTLEVRWPYGSIQDTTGVAANQTVTLTESDVSEVAVPAAPAHAPAIRQPSPNPFAGSVAVSFAAAPGRRASLDVYDIRGRLVATLFDADAPSAEVTLEWNGKDLAGRDAAPGLYFLRLRSGDLADTRRVVRLK